MSSNTQTRPQPVSTERCEQLLREILRIRSVVGEQTTAHKWVAARLRELGMTVHEYAVEGRTTPLVLGVLEGVADAPGVLFDAHYDTVAANPVDWKHDPWGGDVEDGTIFGRGAVDSKGDMVSMLAAIEALIKTGEPRRGPIYFMSDCDGEGGARGAVLMEDLGVRARVGTVFTGEATSNRTIEIAYPGISAWKITAIGRTAHATEPERGINSITKMAHLILAVDEGRLTLPTGTSRWFKPRVTINAIRNQAGPSFAIPERCDAVLSVLTGAGVQLTDIEAAIGAFLAEMAREDGEVRFEYKVLPMGAGRLWLRPGEVDPEHEGVRALAAAVHELRGEDPPIREFNGGWVVAAELMRTNDNGYGEPAVITYGPGDFEQAHAPDEHVRIADVAQAADVFALACQRLLS
jgi:succinyl-diaminopimelate desuccinylase